jgi:hypothetical protein
VNPYKPTKAREVPGELSAGMASRLRTQWKLAYIDLTAKRLARLVALSRLIKSVIGDSFTLTVSSNSVMAATTQAMSQEFGTTSKMFQGFHLFVYQANGGHIGTTAADTCPKSPPFPAFAGFSAEQDHSSRHSPSMLQFPFWQPSETGTFRSRGASPESSLQCFSRLQARV